MHVCATSNNYEAFWFIPFKFICITLIVLYFAKFPFYLDDIFELIPIKINRLIVLKAIVEKMGTEKAPY